MFCPTQNTEGTKHRSGSKSAYHPTTKYLGATVKFNDSSNFSTIIDHQIFSLKGPLHLSSGHGEP